MVYIYIILALCLNMDAGKFWASLDLSQTGLRIVLSSKAKTYTAQSACSTPAMMLPQMLIDM